MTMRPLQFMGRAAARVVEPLHKPARGNDAGVVHGMQLISEPLKIALDVARCHFWERVKGGQILLW